MNAPLKLDTPVERIRAFHAELTGWPKVIDFIKSQGRGPFAKWWIPSPWLLKQA